MSVEAHVYANTGAGDPPNLVTPIATVAAGVYTYATAPLALSSDNTFQVRNFDSITLLEETNTDARVRILLDAAGHDITARPNAPFGLSAFAVSPGGVRVDWQYNPAGQGTAPTGFHVYVGSPTPNFATPAATVPYETGVIGFTKTLAGLAALGASYSGQVCVRAFNALYEETNTNVVGFTTDQILPAAVDGLTVIAIP